MRIFFQKNPAVTHNYIRASNIMQSLKKKLKKWANLKKTYE